MNLIAAFKAFFAALRGNIPLETGDGEAVSSSVASKPRPEHSGVEVVQLLSALQREGRFVDFLMDEIEGATDEQLGAAARFVHQGCRKVLAEYFVVDAVWPGEEGQSVTLEEGFDRRRIDLLGSGAALPATARLVHPGWRLTQTKFPEVTDAFLVDLIQKAEVEL